MAIPSTQASNASIYTTYGVFLVFGLVVAWRFSNRKEFLAAIRSQPAIPLAFNFIASAMGCGILLTYPEIGIVAGVQGVLVYALSSALPIMLFAFVGPLVRKNCPEGFVLTQWVFQRFGYFAGLYLGILTILTMFLYMASELTSIQALVELLTGMNGLPVVIVECVVTTIYTTWGGFHTSFFTDNVQGVMMTLLLVVVSIAMGTNIEIDRSQIAASGLTGSTRLGWQLLYILPVAIASNDCFLSGFWLRTFASRNDKELKIACAVATVVIFVYLTLCGFTGIIADWSHVYPGDPPQDAYLAFFLIVQTLPSWVVCFVLVFGVALSTAVFDSLQSAMVSSVSNDIFRNKLPTKYVRCLVIVVMIPAIFVALKSPNVLQIFLISDLISAAAMPSILLGLSPHLYFLNGFDIIVSGLGGILTVFIFGCIYYGSASGGGSLLLLMNGLYGDDWSAFGAFVAAPVGSLISLVASVLLRAVVYYTYSKATGTKFTVFKKQFKLPVEMNIVDPINTTEEYACTDEESLRNSGNLVKDAHF
ncbi:hypothetical protein POJ06DRAFT_248953 [Lipomyces tetrasporus]|uniref:Urea transporter n=1 Tax=Lipomyces tetrasporus TaxID=54092 RepID=A0AAD7VUS6_9ASCO|nr:uncharacterized protein POJ06DRAFT_248953 [Lipomyces tetrasporus]KAJ8102159.1 hypothetical protein POJ06DRAFT_248953 [Lipomyces tetrasporus]